MLDGQVKRYILWTSVLKLLLGYIILFILTLIIIPSFPETPAERLTVINPFNLFELFSAIIISLGNISIAILSSAIVGTIITYLIRKSVSFKLREDYPKGVQIYRLQYTKLDRILIEFNVGRYPKTEYVSNPILSKIETKIENSSDEELSKNPLFITGKHGSGKSTAAVHLVDIFKKKQAKKHSFPFYHSPKLIISSPQISGNHGFYLHKFKEPVIVVIDDFQNLSDDDKNSVKNVIVQFEQGKFEGFIIGVSREDPHHPRPVIGHSEENLDCSNTDIDKYPDFIRELIESQSNATKTIISDEVRDELVAKVVKGGETPLYIVTLIQENQNVELTGPMLSQIPSTLRGIYENKWTELLHSRNDSERYIIYACWILKKINYQLNKNIVRTIFQCLFKQTYFGETIERMKKTIWFSVTDKLLVASDFLYEVVDIPDSVRTFEELRNILLENTKDTTAISCIQQYSRYYALLHQLAIQYYHDDVQVASEILQKAILIADTQGDLKFKVTALYNLGYLYGKENEIEKAEEYYQEVLKVDPENIKALSNLASLLMQDRRLIEAEKILESLVILTPDSYIIRYAYGEVLYDLEKYAESRAEYEKAIHLNSNFVNAYKNLSSLLISPLTNPNDALIIAKAGLKLEPDSLALMTNCGTALGMLGQYDDAVSILEEVIEKYPKECSLAWQSLGNVYFEKDQFTDAKHAYQQSLNLTPDDKRVILLFGLALQELGQPNDALVEIEKALKMDPEYYDALYSFGLVKLQLGHRKEGCDALYKAKDLCPIEFVDFMKQILRTIGEYCIKSGSVILSTTDKRIFLQRMYGLRRLKDTKESL